MAERIHPKTTPRNEQEPLHPPACHSCSRRRKSHSTICCCFRFCCYSLLLLVLLLAIAAGIFYLVFRPEAPNYSVDDKIGIYYERGSSVAVYYKDVSLCDGVWPQFYQPSNNVTVCKTALKGSTIELTSPMRKDLVAAQTSGKTVP
ncbi:NDR1/HIN1-like protein 13 [Citrus sinensis]|uniref:NDR1/HIN1-like protein 13 n=1 Tax=Citrus sinensis TaxID=2711 RepID=A0ACB8LLZ0_CITSI|nr:NDR1/HIN1-like protein 13 [Citrus sinensis]